jgi:hypothetical protein
MDRVVANEKYWRPEVRARIDAHPYIADAAFGLAAERAEDLRAADEHYARASEHDGELALLALERRAELAARAEDWARCLELLQAAAARGDALASARSGPVAQMLESRTRARRARLGLPEDGVLDDGALSALVERWREAEHWSEAALEIEQELREAVGDPRSRALAQALGDLRGSSPLQPGERPLEDDDWTGLWLSPRAETVVATAALWSRLRRETAPLTRDVVAGILAAAPVAERKLREAAADSADPERPLAARVLAFFTWIPDREGALALSDLAIAAGEPLAALQRANLDGDFELTDDWLARAERRGDAQARIELMNRLPRASARIPAPRTPRARSSTSSSATTRRARTWCARESCRT